MAQLAVRRPFDERDLHDDLGTDPVGPNARQPDRFGERRFRDLQPVESRAELEQQPRVESGSNLPGKDEVIVLEVSDEQCAKADPSALWVRKSADYEVLRLLALHLQP